MTAPMFAGSSDVQSQIELYDQDVKNMTEGPLEWYNTRQGSWRTVDDVHKGLVEQFEKIGLRVDAAVCTMGECRCRPSCVDAEACLARGTLVPIPDAYTFQVTVLGRINRESGFDYDQLQHEIRNNLLDIPGEGGTIKFDEKEFLRKHAPHKHI